VVHGGNCHNSVCCYNTRLATMISLLGIQLLELHGSIPFSDGLVYFGAVAAAQRCFGTGVSRSDSACGSRRFAYKRANLALIFSSSLFTPSAHTVSFLGLPYYHFSEFLSSSFHSLLLSSDDHFESRSPKEKTTKAVLYVFYIVHQSLFGSQTQEP
jgi:hypothetical protein